MFHLYLNPSLAFPHIVAGVSGIEAEGVGQCGGNERTLRTGEVGSSSREVLVGNSLYPIDAVAHLYGVQVDLHDALLAPHHFYKKGEIGFQSLAQPRASRPQEDVLCRLLRDGAAAAYAFLSRTVLLGCHLDGLKVEAVVRHEVLVFAGNDGDGHVYGHLRERHPVVVPLQAFALRHLLHTTDEHQRCGVDGNESVGYNNQDGRYEQNRYRPSDKFEDFTNYVQC